MKKFIFFDLKRNVIINILLGIQICLWTVYMTSLVSLLNFDKNFINRYEKSFDIENIQTVGFDKYFAKWEPLDVQIDDSKKLLKYFDENEIEYGFYNKTDKGITFNELKVSKKDLDDKFSKFITVDDRIYLKEFDYNLIKNYVDIKPEEWTIEKSNIPCILGNSFKRKYKIGDEIQYNGEVFKIKGFLEEGMLISEGLAIGNTELLNSSIIMPLDKEKYLKETKTSPNILIFSDRERIKNIPNDINKFTFYSLEESLDNHIKDINAQKVYDIGRVFTITLIILGTIIVTIGYKIMVDKDRIGILYSVGASKKEIKEIFMEEISISILIGILIGILIYFKNNDKVYYVFMNESTSLNLIISIVIISCLLVSIILVNMTSIDKLTPKEMMGGLTE